MSHTELTQFADKVDQPVGLETILPGIDDQLAAADKDALPRLQALIQDYVTIVKFSKQIGIPFCVENNPYYRAPHSVLHEIGHWAVKPDAHIKVYRTLSRRDFPVHMSDVYIDAKYGEEQLIPQVGYYKGDNDRMPDWDLPDGLDPTPNEKSVRAWTRHVISHLGIADPLDTSRTQNYETQSIGDSVVAKGSSFRTWARASVTAPEALAEFEAFGLNPSEGIFRPPQASLEVPYETPRTFGELEEDAEAMAAQYPSRIVRHEGQIEEWREHIAWKYAGVLTVGDSKI